jgi:hypothetical protein
MKWKKIKNQNEVILEGFTYRNEGKKKKNAIFLIQFLVCTHKYRKLINVL